ncbi:heme peroxidase, partial [Amanita rubescens]
MDKVKGFYQTTIQPTVYVVKQTLMSVAQNNVVRPILRKSYAEPLVQLSGSAAIDDRKSVLAETLNDYAKNYEKASLTDKNKINSTMVKLFQRMAIELDPNTAAPDKYYQCVKTAAVQNFHVTPDFVHDQLFKTNKWQPQDHPQGISGVAFAFGAILTLTLHRENASQSDLRNKASPYFDLSPLYGTNKTETDTIRLRDGTGMLWPDSFTEERLAMLPDSVPALLVLWNRYHNYVAKQLFSRNEKNWENPAILSLEDCLAQDDQIFGIARSITCIHFMNVVQEDFVKGLIGMPMAGPSARLDVLHDVRSITSHKGGYLSTIESYLLYS